MMKKQIILICVLLVLAICIGGCGRKTDTTSGGDAASTQGTESMANTDTTESQSAVSVESAKQTAQSQEDPKKKQSDFENYAATCVKADEAQASVNSESYKGTNVYIGGTKKAGVLPDGSNVIELITAKGAWVIEDKGSIDFSSLEDGEYIEVYGVTDGSYGKIQDGWKMPAIAVKYAEKILAADEVSPGAEQILSKACTIIPYIYNPITGDVIFEVKCTEGPATGLDLVSCVGTQNLKSGKTVPIDCDGGSNIYPGDGFFTVNTHLSEEGSDNDVKPDDIQSVTFDFGLTDLLPDKPSEGSVKVTVNAYRKLL